MDESEHSEPRNCCTADQLFVTERGPKNYRKTILERFRVSTHVTATECPSQLAQRLFFGCPNRGPIRN